MPMQLIYITHPVAVLMSEAAHDLVIVMVPTTLVPASCIPTHSLRTVCFGFWFLKLVIRECGSQPRASDSQFLSAGLSTKLFQHAILGWESPPKECKLVWPHALRNVGRRRSRAGAGEGLRSKQSPSLCKVQPEWP